MSDPTRDFFTQLGRRGYEPALMNATGTLRCDVADGSHLVHWLVSMKKGEVKVARVKGDPDCVLRADKAVFDQIVSGRMNAMSSVLRGALEFEGSARLLVLFQRLMPGPPDAAELGRPAGYARRQP